VIEPIMYFIIGFLIASLLGLVLIPLVHNRAVRLTTRRLEASTPLSLAEIQADKDQLRAEFAMTTRRLELAVEQMKAKTASQMAELGKKTDAINRLKAELGEKIAAVAAMETGERALREQLQTTETEHGEKLGALHDTERQLSEKEAEMARLAADLEQSSVHADSQRIELVALRTQIAALKDNVSAREHEAREIGERLERERRDASAAADQLADERTKADKLGDRVGEVERALVVQTTEAEILMRRVQELEPKLVEQTRTLMERETERNELRDKLAAAEKLQAELRTGLAAGDERYRTEIATAQEQHRAELTAREERLRTALVSSEESRRTEFVSAEERRRGEIIAIEERHRAAIDALTKEKIAAEAKQITARNDHAKVRAENAKLVEEIASLKRETEHTRALEPAENALLRERISDVAAEIARLTAALEGRTSPIEVMLARASLETGAAAPAEDRKAGNGRISLVDRIRDLQGKASRLQPSN
jgi:hypothetical protein